MFAPDLLPALRDAAADLGALPTMHITLAGARPAFNSSAIKRI